MSQMWVFGGNNLRLQFDFPPISPLLCYEIHFWMFTYIKCFYQKENLVIYLGAVSSAISFIPKTSTFEG